MFNLFKSKGPAINDKIYINHAAKENICIEMAKKNPSIIFLVWSKITYDHFQKLLVERHGLGMELLLIDDIIPGRYEGKEIVFLDHHYDIQKEIDLLNSLKLKKADLISSLDDPWLVLFNSERIKEVMKKMGHKDHEAIEHASVSKSIRKAQDKILETGLKDDSPKEVREWYESIS